MYNRLTDEVFKCVDGRFDKEQVGLFQVNLENVFKFSTLTL